ncbi:MAG: helix-turn-helix transcriptional regulator [Clostridia bacterium]|nr:helix-turn-helix transcriptional regulator [Clostridia bacterium]
MSEFVERLGGLMLEGNLNRKTLAQKLNISAACLTHYLQDRHTPATEHLIKIADFFRRSTDFLLGREEENLSLTFQPAPPFSERLAFLKAYFACSSYEIYTKAEISKSSYYDWKSGKRQPTVENVIRLADYFGRRVDFILGRES